MPHLQRHPLATTPSPYPSAHPAKPSDISNQTSILSLVLPTILSSRLRKLPYLNSRPSSPMAGHSASLSTEDLSRFATPPPIYTSRPGSQDFFSSISGDESDGETDAAFRIPPRRSLLLVATPTAEASTAVRYEESSGINWKYASQGKSLYQSPPLLSYNNNLPLPS
ncbi:hypothetical protein P152DRAFT_457089 [Eremomyces bilateralis CBS 781.70]|uniref:Uncharacterized protein n=1 Tax=Eremomyces bilateralis CBS 781.70 TaxID=1392243 RepID=A0A6G1G6N5_9PEZI|nr:uncharacterized protein P152DRAFT_457089 [Eremomyces bilateralis CBS 781.70]KAF1813727.1 hypothetical protein P152DRAFT_457089 [Eremomyces bilateralis CBS 781.70]